MRRDHKRRWGIASTLRPGQQRNSLQQRDHADGPHPLTSITGTGKTPPCSAATANGSIMPAAAGSEGGQAGRREQQIHSSLL
jgi:hypothetical protein